MAGSDAADVVVVDHYGLGEDWERRVKDGLPEATIVALDDLPGRRHAADVLIDPNLGGDGPGLADYVNGRFLRGLSYVPLDDDYLHASDPDARSSGRPNILVSLGSGSNELVQSLAVAFVDDPRTRDTDIAFVVPMLAFERPCAGRP
jgi:UDP-2,4-diacetamido-2,4,6-trideoxy-beta-L-altropyranose hydrolase